MAKIANKVVNGNGIQFIFIDGGEELECSIEMLSTDIIHQLALHGLSQKVGDSYSGAESVVEARALAQGVWDNLKAGNWAVRSGRGGKVVEAMVRATGKDYGECLTVWNAMDKKEQAALKAHPQMKLATAEIDLERATAAQASAPTDQGSDLGMFLKPQAS